MRSYDFVPSFFYFTLLNFVIGVDSPFRQCQGERIAVTLYWPLQEFSSLLDSLRALKVRGRKPDRVTQAGQADASHRIDHEIISGFLVLAPTSINTAQTPGQ